MEGINSRPAETFAQQHGTDALYERWEEQEADVLDVYRESAV